MSRSIVLLDGGMGQELTRRSPDPVTALWGAAVLRDHPALVQELHEDFLRAGARIITLNAYTLTHQRLALKGAKGMFAELQERACELASEAIAAHGGMGRIAGCLPPLYGSYVPDTSPEPEEAAGHFAEIVAAQESTVDLFIIETMSSIEEARGALLGTVATELPIWLGLTVMDDDGTKLRSGEPLSEAIEELRDHPGLEAILINCTRPEAVDQAMPVLAASGVTFVAYANGFTHIAEAFVPGATVEALQTRTDLGPEAYADFAMGWVEAGASIVGGCCEVGPAHIAELARRLTAAGYAISDHSARDAVANGEV